MRHSPSPRTGGEIACGSQCHTRPALPRLPARFCPGLLHPNDSCCRAHDIGSGTWIAHTPSYQDWFTFQDPGSDSHPFHLGDGYLTIRVQKDGHDPHHWFAGYSGGLLSSMDGHGKGFAQQYGYFEASIQTPGTPNTWPGFWLLDALTLTDKTLPDGAEIDITESYGNFGTGPGQHPPGDPD